MFSCIEDSERYAESSLNDSAFRLELGEGSQEDLAATVEEAGLRELSQIAVYAVGGFVDVFKKEGFFGLKFR